jgi:hypothetical protein
MKKHIILVTNREYRTVCGCNPNARTADLMTDATCRKCVESVASLLDLGLAEVGQVWRMHKDKTRTLVREELVLISQKMGNLSSQWEEVGRRFKDKGEDGYDHRGEIFLECARQVRGILSQNASVEQPALNKTP